MNLDKNPCLLQTAEKLYILPENLMCNGGWIILIATVYGHYWSWYPKHIWHAGNQYLFALSLFNFVCLVSFSISWIERTDQASSYPYFLWHPCWRQSQRAGSHSATGQECLVANPGLGHWLSCAWQLFRGERVQRDSIYTKGLKSGPLYLLVMYRQGVSGVEEDEPHSRVFAVRLSSAWMLVCPELMASVAILHISFRAKETKTQSE